MRRFRELSKKQNSQHNDNDKLSMTKYYHMSMPREKQNSGIRENLSLHCKNNKKALQKTQMCGEIIKTIQYQQRREKLLKQLIVLMEGSMKNQNGLSQQQKKAIKRLQDQCNHYEDLCNKFKQQNKRSKQQILSERKTRAVLSSRYRQLQKELIVKQLEFKQSILKRQQKIHQRTYAKHNFMQLLLEAKNKSPADQSQLMLTFTPEPCHIKQLIKENSSFQRDKTIFLTGTQEIVRMQSKHPKAYQLKSQSGQANYLIEKISLIIQKIQSIIGKSSTELQSYSNLIESQNRHLESQIQLIQENLSEWQKSVEEQKNTKRQIQFRKSSIETLTKQNIQENIFSDILKALNIQTIVSKFSEILSAHQVRRLIGKIQYIMNQTNPIEQAILLKDPKQLKQNISEISSTSFVKHFSMSPQAIIANMQRFQQCERIMNKRQFKQQYKIQKAKARVKKIKIRQNIELKK